MPAETAQKELIQDVKRRSFAEFSQSQIAQIQTGGWSVLSQKLKKFFRCLLIGIPLGLLALPCVLVIRLIRPIKLVRLDPVSSDRIGHFCVESEMYFCRKDCIKEDKDALDLFYYDLPISNHRLKAMFDRKVCVFPFAKWIDKVNRKIPGWEKHVIFRRNSYLRRRDPEGLLDQTSVHYAFTDQEEEEGQKALIELGVPDQQPFVCFHARDAAYLDHIYPNIKFTYHNYRDSNIEDYILAVHKLVDRGYYTIRMGYKVNQKIATDNPKIIDYATNGKRTELMDLYLSAKCKFFIASAAGICEIPRMFRIPIATVNYIPLELCFSWSKSNISIFKKLWLKSERRFLTFKEILQRGTVITWQTNEEYDRQGIEVISNTPEEISALVLEMDERLNGTWQTTQEDENLQERFWSLFKSSPWHGVFRSRIGAQFLRENKELLD